LFEDGKILGTYSKQEALEKLKQKIEDK